MQGSVNVISIAKRKHQEGQFKAKKNLLSLLRLIPVSHVHSFKLSGNIRHGHDMFPYDVILRGDHPHIQGIDIIFGEALKLLLH
jgi:hypothetical protein